MNKDQILALVKEHFIEEWCEEDGNGWTEFAGKPDAFLKFAQEVYNLAYDKGRDDEAEQYVDENY